jgi:hypothetical protein
MRLPRFFASNHQLSADWNPTMQLGTEMQSCNRHGICNFSALNDVCSRSIGFNKTFFASTMLMFSALATSAAMSSCNGSSSAKFVRNLFACVWS